MYIILKLTKNVNNYLAPHQGFEPRPSVLETVMLPLTPMRFYFTQ